MTEYTLPIALSTIDEERFGIRTARALKVTVDLLPQMLVFCHENQVSFLIARCAATDLAAAQAMEAKGFQIMDTLVYYTRNLAKSPIPGELRKNTVRKVRPEDADQVRGVAAQAFRDYYGHYHADPRLDRQKCDEAYISWAVNSCLATDEVSEVLVGKSGENITGFATVRLNSPQEGEGVLFGVAPVAQSRGLYWSFMVRAMEWCVEKGANRMVVSTQVTNLTVQKTWVRLGFEPSSAYYTFHKWFDRV